MAFFVFYSVYGRPRTFLTHPTPSIDLPPWSYPTMEKKFCDFWVATSFLSSKALLLKKSTFFLLLLSSLHRFAKRKVLKEEGVCVFYSLTLRANNFILAWLRQAIILYYFSYTLIIFISIIKHKKVLSENL